MNKALPKIIAAHDLSGYGKASLSAVLPILSVMGCYASPLPTAALSTITGVFTGYSFYDLTRNMSETIKHWHSLGLSFDCIYSGFLGNPHQADIILEAQRLFGCTLVVDPVFADDGKLYPTMDSEMIANMRRLSSAADVITPNITEAMYLLGDTRIPDTRQGAEEYLFGLCGMGAKTAVITGCQYDGAMHVCGYCSDTGEKVDVACDYCPGSYHGTGDIFTTVLLGSLVGGSGLADSIKKAADFVRYAIEKTVEFNISPKQGVAIELCLDRLIRR